MALVNDDDFSPANELKMIAKKLNAEITDKQLYENLDKEDKLATLRDEFVIPKLSEYRTVEVISEEFTDCVYFCGNSLGLQPKGVSEIVEKVLENWKKNSIHCHYVDTLPAMYCDKYVFDSISKLVGANEDEVVVMNGLSVNLHLLMVSFYQPTKTRHKILLEAKAFPSDHYAAASQIVQRGYKPEDSMLFLKPREGEETWRPEDVLQLIETEGDSIALIMLPGVHYYTGQVFDMEAITRAAHKKGCMVGFDLAHAIGNIEIHLHDWEVDFACWCTYKYLNSGPGCIAGAFMHEKHSSNNFPKFLGWWGHREETRFAMTNTMELTSGIQGYRLSNPPPLLVACLRASLDVFDKTNMKQVREKSVLLTGYLELLLKHYFAKGVSNPYIDIITPSDYKQRGCQLSLVFSCSVTKIHEELEKRGFSCDIREPNVMRVAPVPLYNTFCDVYRFVHALKKIFSSMQ